MPGDVIGEKLRKNFAATFRAAGQLKRLNRSGWVKKAGIQNPESVADHTFRMALIGAVLGEEAKLDSGKVVRMCLIHDLAESAIGDLTPEQKKSEKSHRALEDKTIRNIFSTLPSRSRARLTKDWAELLENKSKEARLVWRIDKLEMGLQMKDYSDMGFSAKNLAIFAPRSLTKQMENILRDY